MPQSLKEGLDYIPLRVDFFSDQKVKRLRAKFGNAGVMVYIYLLCEIARKGYYIDYDEDLILDISDELNITENSTMQIMNHLLSRSLFDDTLAKSVKVLTAEYSQLIYQKAVSERAKKRASKCIEVDAKFWVLNEEQTESFIKVRHKNDIPLKNKIIPEKNKIIPEKNTTKESKEKKSKVKDSKGEETATPPALPSRYGKNQCASLSEERYLEFVRDYGKDIVEKYLDRADEWAFNKNKKLLNCHASIRKWLEQDNVPKTDHSIDKYNCVINQFDNLHKAGVK